MKSHYVKVVLFGDSAVGKTSLLNALYGNPFNPRFEPTIGAAFRSIKLVRSDESIQENRRKYNTDISEVCIHFWDTAGQERFNAIAPMYSRDAHVLIFVYDINNQETLESILDRWVKLAKTSAHRNSRWILVGNKMDMMHNKTYQTSAIMTTSSNDWSDWGENNGSGEYEIELDQSDKLKQFVAHVKISCKEGTNIDKLDQTIRNNVFYFMNGNMNDTIEHKYETFFEETEVVNCGKCNIL
jgi:small GTP-binding protein